VVIRKTQGKERSGDFREWTDIRCYCSLFYENMKAFKQRENGD